MHEQAQLRLKKDEVAKLGAEAYLVLAMDLYRTAVFKEKNLLLRALAIRPRFRYAGPHAGAAKHLLVSPLLGEAPDAGALPPDVARGDGGAGLGLL